MCAAVDGEDNGRAVQGRDGMRVGVSPVSSIGHVGSRACQSSQKVHGSRFCQARLRLADADSYWPDNAQAPALTIRWFHVNSLRHVLFSLPFRSGVLLWCHL